MVSPDPLLWLPVSDGQVAAYRLRTMRHRQAYYAPVGMTQAAYEDLLKSLTAVPANL